MEHLYACQNKIELLSKQDFEGFSNLKLLDLSHNQISFLEEDFFRLMPQVESLILSKNKIKELGTALNQLKNIIFLDLASNSIGFFNTSFLNRAFNLSLDFRHNDVEFIQNNTEDFLNLKSFKAPNVDISELVDLNSLEELDMSSNIYANKLELSRAINLKKLILKNSTITNTSFLVNLRRIEELDLSDNELDEDFAINILEKENLKVLKLANVGLISARKVETLFDHLEYVDLSANGLIFFEYFILKKISNLKYINLSFNKIKSFFDYSFRRDNTLKYFYEISALVFANFTQTFDENLSNTLFYFNKKLEIAVLSQNKLELFPSFCDEDDTTDECQIKRIYFDSNRIASLDRYDLIGLINLEYLNLENNLIKIVDEKSFVSLPSLETLLLSNNQLAHLSPFTFQNLTNLKLLNLSHNSLGYLETGLLNSLYKLETIDVSNNNLYLIEEFALNNLFNLKNVYLFNNNNGNVTLSYGSFYRFDSIQNIYIDKEMVNSNLSLHIFIDLVAQKNSLTKKRILNRAYFKSVNLITLNGDFFNSNQTSDCDMTITFIKFNIHFNLKTESDLFNYFSNCDQIILKHVHLTNN